MNLKRQNLFIFDNYIPHLYHKLQFDLRKHHSFSILLELSRNGRIGSKKVERKDEVKSLFFFCHFLMPSFYFTLVQLLTLDKQKTSERKF